MDEEDYDMEDYYDEEDDSEELLTSFGKVLKSSKLQKEASIKDPEQGAAAKVQGNKHDFTKKYKYRDGKYEEKRKLGKAGSVGAGSTYYNAARYPPSQ